MNASNHGHGSLAEPYESLISWLESEHHGFYSTLICRNVPGAGRGMFVSENMAGGETLLEIPSSALLNPLTLRSSPLNTIPIHLFPLTASDRNVGSSVKRRRQSLTSTRLDTTQLLTLHLLLSRDPLGRHPSGWKAYLATLPEFANWHPLTWFYADEAEGGGQWAELLACLTVEARTNLEDVRKRYTEDCVVLRSVLRVEEPFSDQNMLAGSTEADYLWAWLNVNTRTVSLPLDIPGNPSLMNHTLVPVLDMLNHTSCSSAQIPHPRQYPSSSTSTRSKPVTLTAPRPRIPSRELGPLIPGKIGFRLIAPHKGLQARDEVLFEYGSHSSAMLFAEYGFVEGPYPTSGPGRDGWLEKEHGSVDLSDLVKMLWVANGMEEAESAEKEDVLSALSCMNRHVIHTTPSPPHPSHSLLMALRVLHLPAHSPKLNPIRAGRVTFISQANEGAALSSLHRICSIVRLRAEEGLSRTRDLKKRVSSGQPGDTIRSGIGAPKTNGASVYGSHGLEQLDQGVWSGLEGMWEEELEVVSAVLGRIERGETYW